MSKVTETVTALAAPVAEKLGLELWDVEYIREAGQWFLLSLIHISEPTRRS